MAGVPENTGGDGQPVVIKGSVSPCTTLPRPVLTTPQIPIAMAPQIVIGTGSVPPAITLPPPPPSPKTPSK